MIIMAIYLLVNTKLPTFVIDKLVDFNLHGSCFACLLS